MVDFQMNSDELQSDDLNGLGLPVSLFLNWYWDQKLKIQKYV